MPRVAAKAPSDDEGLNEEEDSSSKEEKKDEEGKDKTEEAKVKKPKRHNPFMPRVKVNAIQKRTQDGDTENEGGNRTLFDQLEDFRIDSTQPEDVQDVEDLMEWWNTVESWEDTLKDEDMTEKEEAKAFAVTAEKVQKGIRVFNKLFSERAESLWQHVIDLNGIADGLDKFSKNTKIAQITGGSTSAVGGVATIVGLALAPVTMGTSLIVTAVGLGVATAGGLTSAGAGISNQVNNSMDRKAVEKIVQDYQDKMVDLNKCLTFIKQGIENLKRFDLIKMKKHAYNRDFPVLSSSFYEDGAMVGKAILINANEIMRVVQIANVAGSTAARAVQIASMATGVLTGLFVGMDIYFVAKDSKELKKGAKSEFAAKIREVALQLHDGLVELNSIREELQSTTPENNAASDTSAQDSDKKEKNDKDKESSDEDEIDRIKKAIKKDLENREYV
ncbi:apolipoprotein L1 [Pempheris klunzingeri]|uniref:apolipoprotein L1 n=1 Tax=Pempheris klunzingeri TaxID=3127111 RepID=UPI00397F0EF4